jgi:hypothetical protein
MTPFPHEIYPDDIFGQGTPEQLARIIKNTRQKFVEVSIVTSGRYDFNPGTYGQYQYTVDEDTINITVRHIQNGSPDGLDLETGLRTNLGPDCEIKWVIHPQE